MIALITIAGVLLTNGIPHFVAGLQGMPFQSPFAKPSGVGESSPLLNVWWGAANIAGGIALMHYFFAPTAVGWTALATGCLAIGSFGALHFGKVRAKSAQT